VHRSGAGNAPQNRFCLQNRMPCNCSKLHSPSIHDEPRICIFQVISTAIRRCSCKLRKRCQATPCCSRQNALGAGNQLCSSFGLAVLDCGSGLLLRIAFPAFPVPDCARWVPLFWVPFSLGSQSRTAGSVCKYRVILVVLLFGLCGFPSCLFGHLLYLLVGGFLRGCPVL